MTTSQLSAVKSQMGLCSFTRALALAFNEWILMLMLFGYSIFSYVITRFADYSKLQSPCLMCSRFDHILGRKIHLKESHWDMICSKHKSEISSLVYCHAHEKLVDVRGICETCLFSFATTNKSNAETYRLLVGKLGEDSCFGSKSDSSTDSRFCTCCNQSWRPQAAATQVAKPEMLPKSGLLSSVRTGKQSTPKKSVSFNHLPHVGYTELKIHSDTESEALFSEDEGIFKEKNHKFQTVDLQTPPVITLPYDLVTDKLLNLDCPFQPLVTQNDRGELHLKADSLFPELIPVNGVPETSEKVLKEEEIISFDKLFLTSRTMEHSAVDSLCPELISVNGVPETSKKVLKEEEIISFDNLFLTSRTMEHSAAVSKEKEEPIHLQDTSLTPDFKENLANALMEETELICLNDVTSTSVAAETPEDVLKGIDLMSLHDISQEEVPESFTTNTTFVEMSKENPANAPSLEKSELISLSDGTLTSNAADTHEDVLKGIDLMSLHDISPDEVSESFTTIASPVETLKTKETHQVDITCLESEDIVVSSSAPTTSMPENSTENCVSESKEMNETSVSASSVLDMSPPAVTSHIEAALESDSSSFNSMSVAAETNNYSGASWTQEGELLDLADAYNVVVRKESNKDSNEGAQIEQWMKKDTSRVSEDLKALLTQLSASRGIEFLSPRDISPKISVNSSDQETKNLDYEMQLLLQRKMLERNESNLSLEGVAVCEIEGESESDRLKRQVDHDRKLVAGLYKELEEERSASAIATNQAMAMITRLQEEKASFQMEALQNLRMMEEQSEYDMEAIQKLNDLLVEREKVIQDLEAEIEYFRDQTPQKKSKLDVDSDSEGMSNKIQSCLNGFEEERLYITSCVEKIENRVNGEAHVENSATQESVSELHERVERLKGDLYFLEQAMNSLGQGNQGVEFVNEIASHMQTLHSLAMKRQDCEQS